jgi:uncharacterized protein (TIGR03067 family)
MLRLGAVAACVIGLVGATVGQPPAPAPAAPTGDLGLLQGYWKPLAIEYEGKSQVQNANELKKLTGVFDQAEYHLYFKEPDKDPLKLAVMNVTLDTSTTPKTINFEFARGELKGQKRHGIYEIAGNQLKLCYGPVEKPKPATFSAPANSGLFLEVWAKQPMK